MMPSNSGSPEADPTQRWRNIRQRGMLVIAHTQIDILDLAQVVAPTPLPSRARRHPAREWC